MKLKEIIKILLIGILITSFMIALMFAINSDEESKKELKTLCESKDMDYHHREGYTAICITDEGDLKYFKLERGELAR